MVAGPCIADVRPVFCQQDVWVLRSDSLYARVGRTVIYYDMLKGVLLDGAVCRPDAVQYELFCVPVYSDNRNVYAHLIPPIPPLIKGGDSN